MAIASEWLAKDQTEAEREVTRNMLRNSSKLLEKFKQICLQRQAACREAMKISDYDSPSWPYRMADKNGELRELDYIIKLLTIE